MNDIAHVIELAVAPLFLLAGIGAFVNAFALRLGRIVDRIRLLERETGSAEPERWQARRGELTHPGYSFLYRPSGLAPAKQASTR